MTLFTSKKARKLTNKANRETEKELQKEVKSLIRTIKADIKRTSKKGISDLRIKIRNTYTFSKAKQHFANKGFRCYEYSLDEYKYLAIEW